MEFEPQHEPANRSPEQTLLPSDSSGQLRFTNWAIGVVDDDSRARDCAHALEAEDVAAWDICIVPGATALQQLRTTQQLMETEPVLARLRDRAVDAVRDVKPVRAALETQARAGRTFLGIYVPDSDQMDAIRNTLEEHQVHDLYLFEPTMITQLI